MTNTDSTLPYPPGEGAQAPRGDVASYARDSSERPGDVEGQRRPLVAFALYGDPAPQGSKRHVGNGRMIESSRRVKPWRQDVKAAAEEFMWPIGDEWKALDVPLVVQLVFTLPRPKSAPKRRIWPDRKPDIDKLARSTLDALSGLIADDARVVDLHARKAYVGGPDPDALFAPGAVIRIWAMQVGE